jgi:hypothetical protein
MTMAGRTVAEALERALRRGPQSAAQLLAALRVSQPTLSRALRGFGPAVTFFRIPGERAPRYALLRQLPMGLDSRQRISRVLSTGSIEPFAEVEFLAGGGTLERIGRATRLYEGLPPYMAFAAPSGFLGRQVAHKAAQSEPGFPENLRDWSEDHRIAFLFTRGLNLAGNLVFGQGPLQRELDLRQLPPTPAADRLQHYEALASELREASYGSSAGGEQPKFLAVVEDVGHVIVKFAKRGSRMAELLPMEHLALQALGSVGVPASRTQVFASAAHVFLEVQRFDRIGATGRVGMLSAGSVDDEFFGQRQSWPQFAARCAQERYISAGDARFIDIMAAFSELIGNNDRHYENISLLIGEDGEYAGVAPAYDILPMRYATLGGGVDPELTPINPTVGTIGAQPQVWDAATKAAEGFWTAVQRAKLAAPISRPFRELAAANLAVARAFVAPLLPAAQNTA